MSEKRSYLPASLIPLIHPLSRTRFHIINTMTATLILRALKGACGSLYLFSGTARERQVLFCIQAAGEPTMTALPLRSDSIQLGL